MTDKTPENDAAQAAKPKPKDDDREARLAAALRENLKRRKAQARQRTEDGETDETP